MEERFRAGDLSGLPARRARSGGDRGRASAARSRNGDVVASTHRAHAHAIAMGMHPNALMAELYGKVEGCSRGYGGSMHLYDVERGLIGANAVVGGGLPSITGAALAFKLRDEPRVAVAFFGDGATNTGTFHESLNLAQLWQRAGRLRLREQRLGGVDPGLAAAPDHGSREAGGRVRNALDHRRRPGRRGRLPRRAPCARSTPATARAPSSCSRTRYRLTGHYVGDPQVYRVEGGAAGGARDPGPARAAAGEARALRGGVGGARARGRRSSSRPPSSSR